MLTQEQIKDLIKIVKFYEITCRSVNVSPDNSEEIKKELEIMAMEKEVKS
jgi:hypothetical protein